MKARALILLLLLQSLGANQVAYSADTKVLNNENSCAGPWGSSSILWEGPASRFVAPSAKTLVSATLNYSVTSGSNSPTQASSQRLAFWTNSGSLPSTLVGRMRYASYSGTRVTFTGNVVLPASGTYWVQVQSNFSAYFCFVSTQSNAGSEAGWSTQVGMSYGSSGAGETPTAFTAFGGSITNYSIAYSLYAAGLGSVSVAAAEYVTAAKGAVDTLTATTSTSGTATFFANGKKIPRCINLVVASTSATCLWRPAVTGNARIRADFKPTSGSTVTSNEFLVKILNRKNSR